MRKILTLLTLFLVIISCASPTVVNVIGPNDNKMNCKELSADKLGSIVIREILRKSKLGKNDIDEVIMGQVLTAGGGQNPARQAAINAGINISKPAHIVNQVCGSGLRSVISAFQRTKILGYLFSLV